MSYDDEAFSMSSALLDLLEIPAPSAPKDQRGILGREGFLESRASDLTGWMASRGQTGFQGNSAKSDLL
ncbi:hypothetical protein EYF80_029340 [Liparis tanakae]|uniref:Uncharacterized protein n=1 Tax=Liparis tanakae TaxID=230148 RepID=A0A4Z2H409_9TELE|nr:hypothetical protein EYF80_029340 [Liparis tanakae]